MQPTASPEPVGPGTRRRERNHPGMEACGDAGKLPGAGVLAARAAGIA